MIPAFAFSSIVGHNQFSTDPDRGARSIRLVAQYDSSAFQTGSKVLHHYQ